MSEAPRHIYERDGDSFAPTALAIGPWDRRFQNGVALNALVAHVVEGHPTLAPMVPARLVLDLLRPTAMAPVVVRVECVREGRRLQLLQIDLMQDGAITARATALRVRAADAPATASEPPGNPREELPGFNSDRSSFRHIIETRLESGGLESPGPGVVWARVFGEIVPGVAVSPLVQAAMAADFGSGLSSFVDWREWTFANVDISLHLARAPAGEWVRVAAETTSAGNGVAVVATRLTDAAGEFGYAHQTLYIDRRTAR